MNSLDTNHHNSKMLCFDDSKILGYNNLDVNDIINSFYNVINDFGMDIDELLKCDFKCENELEKYLFDYYKILRFCVILRYYINESENKELYYLINEQLNDLILLKGVSVRRLDEVGKEFETLLIECDNNQVVLNKHHPLIISNLIKYKHALYNDLKQYKNIDLSNIVAIQASAGIDFNIIANNDIHIYNKFKNDKFYFKYNIKLDELYSISSLRFIEKIEKVINDHPELSTIETAIFGKTDIENLKKELSRTYPNKIFNFCEYKLIVNDGSLVFDGDNQQINLCSNDDLIKLIRKYNLILLLDKCCFYQTELINESYDLYNYYSYVKNYDNVKIDDFYNDNGIISFKNLYTILSENYYSFLTDELYELKYDTMLFNLLSAVVGTNGGLCDGKAPDVYAFISQGDDIIGNKKLSDFCYCKDDYYAGKKVTVVKFPNRINSDLSNDYFDESLLKYNIGKVVSYQFSAWKLFKSLDSECAEKNIECLRNINVKCQFEYMEHIHIKYSLEYIDSTVQVGEECLIKVNNLVSFILNSVFVDTDLIVSKYLEDLFLSILLNRSNNIKEIFFVYLLRSRRKILPKFKIEKGTVFINELTIDEEPSYKQKKMMSMIMQRLGDLLLHQQIDRKQYIMNDIYNDYFSQIDRETMAKIIKSINNLCLELGIIEDNIYINTSIFNEE